jgi:phosphotransferase system HPr-like phosphotransfer protein
MLQPPATPQGLAASIQEASRAREGMDKCVTNLDKLLRELSMAMSRHHSRVTVLLTQASARPEAKTIVELQQLQAAFNAQYLHLQAQMQNENRSYTSISNIMKTKHDTVKNSISNVR